MNRVIHELTILTTFFQVALPIRLKAVHILNSGMATQMLMKMVQRFAKQELLEKVFINTLTYNITFYNTKLYYLLFKFSIL